MSDTHPADRGRAEGQWSDGHPTDGALRAYLDGELASHARLRALWHLRHCRACRAALEEQRALGRRTAALLAQGERDVDVGEGWQRFLALSAGARVLRQVRPGVVSRLAPPRLVASLLLAGGLAAGLVVAKSWRQGGTAPPPVGFGAAAESATTALVRDTCCWDLDGGGRGDDGVFTRSRAGEVVECVVLYDDVDRSGRLTASDVIRYVSDAGACGLPPTVSLPLPATDVLPAALALTLGV